MGAGRVIAVDRVPERLDVRPRIQRRRDAQLRRGGRPGDGAPGNDRRPRGRRVHRRGRHGGGGEQPSSGCSAWMPSSRPGAATALAWCIQTARKGGNVSIVGVYGPPWNLVPIGTAMNKGLTLRMNQCNVKRYVPHLLKHIREGRIDARRIITHRFPLAAGTRGVPSVREEGPRAASSACSCRTERRDGHHRPERTGSAATSRPAGPGRIDDADPTARPGRSDGAPPAPFPTAPERVVVQRPRVEVLQIPGRKKPVWVVSNAQPPRGLAGRLRRRAFAHSRAPRRALDAAARRGPARGATHAGEAMARLRRRSARAAGGSPRHRAALSDSDSVPPAAGALERARRSSDRSTASTGVEAPSTTGRGGGHHRAPAVVSWTTRRRRSLGSVPRVVSPLRSSSLQLTRDAGRVLGRRVGQLALGEGPQLGEPVHQATTRPSTRRARPAHGQPRSTAGVGSGPGAGPVRRWRGRFLLWPGRSAHRG